MLKGFQKALHRSLIKALEKKEADAQSGYALSPNKGVCIMLTGPDILNHGVFDVIRKDLSDRSMTLLRGTCAENGFSDQDKSYKEKLENMDVTAWNKSLIA